MFAAPYNARKSLAQKCLITTLIRLKYLNFRAKDDQNWIYKRVIQVKNSRIFNLIFSAKIQIFRLFYLLKAQIFSVKISNIWVGKLFTKTNFEKEFWKMVLFHYFLGEMLEKVNQQILKVGQSSTHTCRQMLENQIKSGDNVISLVLSSKG